MMSKRVRSDPIHTMDALLSHHGYAQNAEDLFATFQAYAAQDDHERTVEKSRQTFVLAEGSGASASEEFIIPAIQCLCYQNAPEAQVYITRSPCIFMSKQHVYYVKVQAAQLIARRALLPTQDLTSETWVNLTMRNIEQYINYGHELHSSAIRNRTTMPPIQTFDEYIFDILVLRRLRVMAAFPLYEPFLPNSIDFARLSPEAASFCMQMGLKARGDCHPNACATVHDHKFIFTDSQGHILAVHNDANYYSVRQFTANAIAEYAVDAVVAAWPDAQAELLACIARDMCLLMDEFAEAVSEGTPNDANGNIIVARTCMPPAELPILWDYATISTIVYNLTDFILPDGPSTTTQHTGNASYNSAYSAELSNICENGFIMTVCKHMNGSPAEFFNNRGNAIESLPNWRRSRSNSSSGSNSSGYTYNHRISTRSRHHIVDSAVQSERERAQAALIMQLARQNISPGNIPDLLTPRTASPYSSRTDTPQGVDYRPDVMSSDLTSIRSLRWPGSPESVSRQSSFSSESSSRISADPPPQLQRRNTLNSSLNRVLSALSEDTIYSFIPSSTTT